ncbi:MAG: hypothetical protein AAFW67_09490, partial [Cyanobacteria bacterium J06638_38]
MKLLLLKTLLQRRARDEGYVLPMVIAIGLVMVLLGTVNLTSANEESTNAITQNSRSDALGIAEVGIAKYREMLNRNRILTLYNHNQWTSTPTVANPNLPDVVGQSCDLITSTPGGWAYTDPPNAAFNAVNWQPVTLDETIVNRDLDNDGLADNTSVIIGGYQLVSYEYDNDGNIGDGDGDGIPDDINDNGIFNQNADVNPNFPTDTTNDNDTDDDGVSDARGILTVKARTLDGSEAQIQVEIPLRINQQDMNNLAPALWIGNGNTANLGGLIVGDTDGNNITDDFIDNLTGAAGSDGIPDANIVASSPNDGTNDGCNNSDQVNGNSVVDDPRSLPPIDEIAQTIADIGTSPLGVINNLNALAAGLNFLGATNHANYNPDADPATFDPAVDCAVAENCRYYYNNIPATLDRSYIVDGVARVTLYSTTDLSIDATGVPNLTIGSNVSSKFMEIYSTGDISINTAGEDVTI